MPINPAVPHNPLPNGGESLQQNNNGRSREANDSERDAGQRPSSNAAQSSQRVTPNEATTEARPGDGQEQKAQEQKTKDGIGENLDMVV